MTDNKLWLTRPDAAYGQGFAGMLAAYRALGDERYSDLYADPCFDVVAYAERTWRLSLGEGLPEDWVPTTVFWLTDGEHVYGTGRLRHFLNDELMIEGGNIGYDINPLYRRQGYGTVMLTLLLVEAEKLGIGRALVTCDEDNEGSRKIIERNGGVYDGTSISPESGQPVRRYWVDTTPRTI